MSPHGYLAHARPVPIAHRGGSLEAEENTLPAFARAVAMGYRHVETDVHLTRDGEVVIHHDPTLARMTGDPRAIASMSWAELSRVRTPGGASIPRLSDLLEEHPGLLVNIEAKSDAVIDPLASLLQRSGAMTRCGAASFAGARTNRLRAQLGKPLCWSPSYRGVFGLWLGGWGLPLPRADFPVVQVPLKYRGIDIVTRRFVRAAHKRGVQVQVWTVNDAAEMRRLLDLGVDGIMTDRPSVLKDVLIARGEWRD
ncbi:glycerophosphodiester phosphodiesterase [Pararhodobacter zhoushanensis]|jgi:glycerophosphoryl diester phosphodiesterase|uniref:Glycerophosphodiester phosphodiesterase n=1 Tax=Pararhodobacter zhoushanensis TaxID=2479545 RepID=A0ABT3GWR6_9RHOB|nr:glycerophosphodiester phosphodiesterase [Pararhodobacter zhoushanensis]MCW1931935.1 glycerophosphodiester phosphodiesterase [Pararhodobacter zhoushanensis]